MKAVVFYILVVSTVAMVYGQHYDDTHAIFKDIINSSRYHTDVIPVLNQSKPIHVTVDFNVMSIVRVEDTTQSFVCNGIFAFYWTDEKLTWDPDDYGGQTIIHLAPKAIWRPRVVLINTLEDRDMFEDDYSPTYVMYNGSTHWLPGSLFATSCSLSLLKYPFDEQNCYIRMMPMGLVASELIFEGGTSNQDFYTINGEWSLDNTWIDTYFSGQSSNPVSQFDVHFTLKRRPTLYVLNTILPVVFLSLLNMVVFCIPVESGEKISYGITVVLAISVTLSIISEMLPRSSQEVPYVTIYLFSLYVVSVLTVLDSVLIVFLHHVEEKAAYHRRVLNKFSSAAQKIAQMRRTIAPMQDKARWSNSTYSKNSKDPIAEAKSILDQLQAGNTKKVDLASCDDQEDKEGPNAFQSLPDEPGSGEEEKNEASGPSKYRLIGDHLDFLSFFVFIVIWIIINTWFFIAVNL